MKSSINYKFQVLSRLLKLYFHWNNALFIMHNYVTHLFFFKASTFPLAIIPFLFFCCLHSGLIPYPFSLHLPSLASPANSPPRVTVDLHVPGTSGFFPGFSGLILCSFQISWTLAPRTHSLASMPWSSGFSTDLFGRSVLFSFLCRPSSSADSCSLHHLSWYFTSNS